MAKGQFHAKHVSISFAYFLYLADGRVSAYCNFFFIRNVLPLFSILCFSLPLVIPEPLLKLTCSNFQQRWTIHFISKPHVDWTLLSHGDDEISSQFLNWKKNHPAGPKCVNVIALDFYGGIKPSWDQQLQYAKCDSYWCKYCCFSLAYQSINCIHSFVLVLLLRLSAHHACFVNSIQKGLNLPALLVVGLYKICFWQNKLVLMECCVVVLSLAW